MQLHEGFAFAGVGKGRRLHIVSRSWANRTLCSIGPAVAIPEYSRAARKCDDAECCSACRRMYQSLHAEAQEESDG